MTLLKTLLRLTAFAATLAAGPVLAQSPVAFRPLTAVDPAGPPLEGGVWLPADAEPGRTYPLVVMSHGNGGIYSGHSDTAEALAAAGFIVAAVNHTGDNYRDQSRASEVIDRPRQLKVLIDHMVSAWDGPPVDPARIGAFGFSSGGFTVLAAAGGRPDLRRVLEHCRDHPDFYDCRLIRNQPPSTAQVDRAWTHDTRIRAVVAAAPALGYTFTREGLTDVTQPVQLWRAGQDRVLPHPFYAQAVHDALPTPPEYHVVEAADHFDFLPPCSPQLEAAAPIICQPTPGLDRATFHVTFNAEVVAFFTRTLSHVEPANPAG